VPALLFASYSPIFGGAERVLLDCAGAVAGRHVLACPPGELAAQARAAGLTVLTIPERELELRSGAGAGGRALRGLVDHGRELRWLARELDPDLVVAWGMRSALGWRLAGSGRPFAFAHNDFLPGRLIGAAVAATAARAELVIVPSRAVADDLDPHGRLGKRLQVIHPGVDLGAFSDAGTPETPPEVLVLGAVTTWKRPDLALEICARARRRRPDLRLRLVGAPITAADPTLERLRARAAAPDLAGAVELAGPSRDPRAELRRATCLLHCATREPFGLVLVEAMACGRPVVVADGAGPREIVDGTCAWLYPADDADAGAAALLELLDDPGRARTVADAGRRRAHARFDRQRTRAGFAAAVTPLLRPRTDIRPAAASAQLSVVTVTHNSERELEALLDSVARHLPGARMVVVDCASDDGSLELARRRPWVETVALGENIGFGRACNRGVQRVRTPVTALLNPDVELLDGSLLQLAAEALRDDRPQRLLAPRVLNGDGSRQDTVHPAPGAPADLIRALIPPALIPGRLGASLAPWRATEPRRVGWAVGCALLARTGTLRALGPFDEGFFLYGEDLELGLRARQQDVATWLWPAARVVHHGARSATRAFGGEPFGLLARGRHAAVARRLGPRRARLDDGAQAVTFASRLALKRALGRPADRERQQLSAVISLRRRSAV
jgi:N-acetylglucosaminyl-diphospho-decaprenol L-rhamnosyltransferase